MCERVWETLYDYPSLRTCNGLLHYVDECVRLAWALTLQNPPLIVDYESRQFDPSLHVRFHTSDPDSTEIKCVLWPMLTEGDGGICVYRGVVITWCRTAELLQWIAFASGLTLIYVWSEYFYKVVKQPVSVFLHTHWMFHMKSQYYISWSTVFILFLYKSLMSIRLQHKSVTVAEHVLCIAL